MRFPGQFAESSELYWNYYRHYLPKEGRYLQPDPMGIDSSDNLYSYVEGSPTRYVDPMGLVRVEYKDCGGANGLTYCDGNDGFTYENCNKGCSRHCTELHEQRHVSDYRSRYPKSCDRRDHGESPDTGWRIDDPMQQMLGHKTDPFIWESDCNAYGVSVDCAKKMIAMAGDLCDGKGWCKDLFGRCCQELKEYRDNSEEKRKLYCSYFGR